MHRITAMSSTTAISLADSLPTIVPKLDLFGLNWTIFHICFQDAVEAKAFGATLIVPAQNLLLELQIKRLPTVFNGKRIREL